MWWEVHVQIQGFWKYWLWGWYQEWWWLLYQGIWQFWKGVRLPTPISNKVDTVMGTLPFLVIFSILLWFPNGNYIINVPPIVFQLWEKMNWVDFMYFKVQGCMHWCRTCALCNSSKFHKMCWPTVKTLSDNNDLKTCNKGVTRNFYSTLKLTLNCTCAQGTLAQFSCRNRTRGRWPEAWF